MLTFFGGMREWLYRLSTNIHRIEDGEKVGSLLSRFCPSDPLLSVASNKNGFIIYLMHIQVFEGVCEHMHTCPF